jgi:hypothetical protein
MVSAVHLELHDQHMTSDPAFQAWLAGRSAPQEPAVQYRAYTEAVLSTVRRGVIVRRARIVSEPVSDYVRWELRDRIYRLLDQRLWRREQTDLYFLLGCLNGLMAITANQLGYPDAARS